jgi:hypothetical protein
MSPHKLKSLGVVMYGGSIYEINEWELCEAILDELRRGIPFHSAMLKGIRDRRLKDRIIREVCLKATTHEEAEGAKR